MRILFIFTMLLFLSCSTMNYNIRKNHRFTEKLTTSLFEKYGNVFYLGSTYATFSRVWIYHKDEIRIYSLANGKVYKEEEYDRITNKFYQVERFSKKSIMELDDCLELSGDGFGFRIKNGNNIIQEGLPISIDCFKNGKYKSNFFNEIVRDITTYEMWEIKIVD